MASCLICGVGGQGVILASRVIAEAAMDKGLSVRTSETIGMAQRGGSVASHVRFGDGVFSPLIPFGEADALLAFEPGEAVRCLPYVKQGGLLITCDRAVQPVRALTPYSGTEMVQYLRRAVRRCYVLSVRGVRDACGSGKAVNMALVGALVGSGITPFDLADAERAMEKRVKEKFIGMNQDALRYGAQMMGRRADDHEGRDPGRDTPPDWAGQGGRGLLRRQAKGRGPRGHYDQRGV